MVFHNHTHQLRDHLLALLARELIDATTLGPAAVHTLPTGGRVSAHDGVHGREMVTGVVGRAPGSLPHSATHGFGALVHPRIGMGCGQCFDEALIAGRKTVVELITRGP